MKTEAIFFDNDYVTVLDPDFAAHELKTKTTWWTYATLTSCKHYGRFSDDD